MSLIAEIARRRIRRNASASFLHSAALFCSSGTLTLLVIFQVQVNDSLRGVTAGLPLGDFMEQLRSSVTLTAVFLTVLTVLTVKIFSDMRFSEIRQSLAVLTSLGATGWQKSKMLFVDILVLYVPPVLLGTAAGLLAAALAGTGLSENTRGVEPGLYFATWPFLSGILLLLILPCILISFLPFKRRSVMQKIRKQNPAFQLSRHSFRRTRAFTERPLLKQLAQKSVDYYRPTYNRIAVSFACAFLYPALAVLLFVSLMDLEIVPDADPFDGVDTTAAVMHAFRKIFSFFGAGAAILTCSGVLQALLMARLQVTTRRRTAIVYRIAGMSQTDLHRLLSYERRSVLLRTAAVLVSAVAVLTFCYGII